MKRNISALKNTEFDTVIIGGGIHGASAFYELARAGFRVALVEKGDFGEATSASSLKILHSGLRYLQHLHFRRMRESIRSRHHFMEMAPDLIQPMPCLMPTSGFGIKSRPVMRLAIAVFDLIGWDRNKNSPPEKRVKKGKSLSKTELLTIAPGVNQDGLTGAALWYDDLILNTERMTLSFVKAGCDSHDGIAANYLKAEEIVAEGSRVCGVRITDQLSKETFTIRADKIVNAAGPWAGTISSPGAAVSKPEDLAKAVNIVVKKPLFKGYGIGMAGTKDYQDKDAVIKRGSRLFFFAPWKNQTIIGTTYRYYRDENDNLRAEKMDIDELLEEVNSIYPLAALTREDVIFVHAGLSPAHEGTNYDDSTAPQMIKHSRIIDHQQEDGVEGLYTIEGVKYTTAPEMARQLAALFAEKDVRRADLPAVNQRRESRRKISLSTARVNRLKKDYPHIAQNYGRTAPEVFQLMEDVSGTADILQEASLVTRAEVIHAVEEEMAVCLADIVLRRTNSSVYGCPSKEELYRLADCMGQLLGWNEAQRDEQVGKVEKHFAVKMALGTVEKQQIKA